MARLDGLALVSATIEHVRPTRPRARRTYGGLYVRAFEDATPLAHDAEVLRTRAGELGYLFFRGLLRPAFVRSLRHRVLELCARRGWIADDTPLYDGIARPGVRAGAYDADFTSLQVEMHGMPEFRAMRTDPALLAMLERLYGEPPRAERGDICRIKSPAAPDLTTPPHQDHFFIGGSPLVWTAWIPLGHCPTALGGLAVLPGSHRDGLRSHEGPREDCRGVAVPPDAVWAGSAYRCGDVLLFNCLTVHRARPNVTANQLRVSADFRYQPMSEPL